MIQLKRITPLFVVALLLACFAMPQTAQAVNPPPVGGYRGENTATGDVALLSLKSGADNTATGFDALLGNTSGNLSRI